MKERLKSRPRASALGRKPMLSATCFIRSRVSAAIRPLSFSALETVETLTPAARATSWIVIRPALVRWLLSSTSYSTGDEKTFAQRKCQYEKTFSQGKSMTTPSLKKFARRSSNSRCHDRTAYRSAWRSSRSNTASLPWWRTAFTHATASGSVFNGRPSSDLKGM